MNPEFIIRPYAESSDWPFVFDAWANSFRSSVFAGTVRNNQYFDVICGTIKGLLERGMRVLILADRKHLNVLVGFIAFEVPECKIPVIHYLYIKDSFRRQGLGGALLKEVQERSSFDELIYTHRTKYSRFFRGARHVALLARRKNLEPVRKSKNESYRNPIQYRGPVRSGSTPEHLEQKVVPGFQEPKC